MKSWRPHRIAIAALVAAGVACPRALALVTFNDSHDHVYVTGTFGVSHDSNIFANSNNTGDFVYTYGATIEYTRRNGWIGVNASVSANGSRFGKVKNQNFTNPSYSLEFTKQTGRTTGSLTIGGARQNQADSAENLRSSAWNYNVGLNFKYPISERYSASGTLGYGHTQYEHASGFPNLSTYTLSTDLFYVFTTERDLLGGYRYRYEETGVGQSYTDHAFTVGVTGRVIKGLNGTVRAGYEFRVPHGFGTGDAPRYDSWTGSASTTYPINRKIALTGQVSKDFSTTASDTSVNSLQTSLDLQYAYSAKWNFTASTGWGDSRFLGEKGRVVLNSNPPPLLGRNRHDNFATWSLALGYTYSEHLKINFTYTWFENWSTLAFADFIRASWGLNLSSRW